VIIKMKGGDRGAEGWGVGVGWPTSIAQLWQVPPGTKKMLFGNGHISLIAHGIECIGCTWYEEGYGFHVRTSLFCEPSNPPYLSILNRTGVRDKGLGNWFRILDFFWLC
jgi:hypothetical protein